MIRHPLAAWLAILVLGAELASSMAGAQGIPAAPKKFVVRPIGGDSATGGATVAPPASPAKTRYITHVVLSESRQWTSAEGKEITGKLIAFEDIVVEVAHGGVPPGEPVLPAHPTVVRAGKARLLVNNKPSEVLLERLVPADREFIEQVRATRAKAAAP